MSVVALCLINAQAAPTANTTLYICGSTAGVTNTVIDKFTATNTDSSTHTLSVNIIPAMGLIGAGNLIAKAVSITAGSTYNFSAELQNHILNNGDQISVIADTAAFVVVRASGREVT